MATDGGLRRLFEKPLPENPTLLEALSSWNHIHPKRPIDPASFTEIFGELHFQEKPDTAARGPTLLPTPRPLASWLDVAADMEKSKDDLSLDSLLAPKPNKAAAVKRSASFCMKSSESLQLCTEGLGSESTVDADDMVKDGEDDAAVLRKEDMDIDGDVHARGGESDACVAVSTREQRPFPPPIRSIGRRGKPVVCFRSFREEGRFVLMEVVIPGKEILQASREGGRLRLHFVNGAGVGVEEEVEMEATEDGHIDES